MNLKSKMKQLREDYVVRQVERAELPEFTPGGVHRYRAVFSGRVQKVGFRLEVKLLAERLGLTGFCQNLDNGDVLAEIQGPTQKVDWLIAFMESLRRVRITDKTVEELPVIPGETGFLRR